jgi:hypothetical protein
LKGELVILENFANQLVEALESYKESLEELELLATFSGYGAAILRRAWFARPVQTAPAQSGKPCTGISFDCQTRKSRCKPRLLSRPAGARIPRARRAYPHE